METQVRVLERTIHSTTTHFSRRPKVASTQLQTVLPRSLGRHCSRIFIYRRPVKTITTISVLVPHLPSILQTPILHYTGFATRRLSASHPSYPSRRTPRRSQHSMATSDPSVPASINAAPPSHQEPKPLGGVEASKRLAAYKAVEDHFDTSYKYIGIGSGSTVVYVVEAIAAKGRAVTSRMIFVPTYEGLSYNLRM